MRLFLAPVVALSPAFRVVLYVDEAAVADRQVLVGHRHHHVLRHFLVRRVVAGEPVVVVLHRALRPDLTRRLRVLLCRPDEVKTARRARLVADGERNLLAGLYRAAEVHRKRFVDELPLEFALLIVKDFEDLRVGAVELDLPQRAPDRGERRCHGALHGLLVEVEPKIKGDMLHVVRARTGEVLLARGVRKRFGLFLVVHAAFLSVSCLEERDHTTIGRCWQ